jgi:hypothetical protein
MPNGIEITKLDSVYLADGPKIAVYPEVMKMFDLKPGQIVDEETAKAIIAANQRIWMKK